MKHPTHLFILMITSVLEIGCSEQSGNSENEDTATTVPIEQASQSRVVRERPAESSPPALERNTDPRPASLIDPAQQMPQLTGELETDGYGLSMIIDGSSPEAFLQSLEIIASESSTQQYQTFHSSMQYLRTSSLDRSELSSFYQTLDGRTAEEVIELAAIKRVRRGR